MLAQRTCYHPLRVTCRDGQNGIGQLPVQFAHALSRLSRMRITSALDVGTAGGWTMTLLVALLRRVAVLHGDGAAVRGPPSRVGLRALDRLKRYPLSRQPDVATGARQGLTELLGGEARPGGERAPTKVIDSRALGRAHSSASATVGGVGGAGLTRGTLVQRFVMETRVSPGVYS